MIDELSPEKVYFLGDVCGYYYGQNECLDLLRRLPGIRCTLGNHDNMFLSSLGERNIQQQLAAKYGKAYLWPEAISKDNLDFMADWPRFIGDEIDGLRMFFCHGTLDNYLEGRLYPDGAVPVENLYRQYDIVFHGHTHHKMIKKTGDTMIYNPGSLGQQRDGKGCSFIVFDTSRKDVTFEIVKYDPGELVNEIRLNDADKKNNLDVLFRQAGD